MVIRPQRTNRRAKPPARTCSRPRCRALATGDAGRGSANRIAKDDRRHLGRGAVPVRRHRRALGRGAAPHRRTSRADCSSHADPPTRRCENASPPSSTLSTTGSARPIPARSRTCAPRCHATAPSWNGSTRAPPPNFSPGASSWLETCQNAFADVDVDPERVREVASFIPGAMRGLVSERQLGSVLRPGPGPTRLDQRDRRLPAALARRMIEWLAVGRRGGNFAPLPAILNI